MGARRPSAPSPQPCPLSQHGRSAPRPPRNGDPKRASGSCILQRETLLGSKPPPPAAFAPESSASGFRPRPCALHRAMRGWVASGSLGPAALLGVSGTRNPLLTCSPSWGSRIGRSTAFCAQAPATPPEPARPLSAEAPKQWRPKTSFWELHPAKGNSPPAANHSLTVPLCRNSTQAVSTPGPPLSIGQSGAGLPLAPWALLLCWGSPAPETHS